MLIPVSRDTYRRAAAVGLILVLLGGGPLAGTVNASQNNPSVPGEAPPAPPVGELVARALANAPSIAARRARLEAAQAALESADVLPDPSVEFEFRDGGFPRLTLGSDVMSMVGATVRQPILTPGRRSARRAEAVAEVDQRHAETDATACDLTAAVRLRYGRLYAIDRERAIVRDAEEMARLLAETASARYSAGESDQTTVLRAQLERTRLGERAVDLDTERLVVVATLNRLLDQPPATPLGEVRELPEALPLPGAFTALPDLAASVAPDVSVRKAEVAAASMRVDLARQELRPSYTLGGAFYWQGGTDRIAAVSVGVEWPLRKNQKQRPAIAASERELEAARYDLQDTAAQTRADATRLIAEIRRAEEQIVRYRQGLLPQSSAALDSARASYLGGRGDFASVLDEFRRWTEIHIELAQREASRFAAWGQLDVLVNPAQHGDWSHPREQGTDARKEPRS